MVIKATYQNNLFQLATTNITSDDIVFELTSSSDMECFLCVTFYDKTQRTIQLTKTNTGTYRGRLKVHEEELYLLANKANLSLCIYTAIQSVVSNSVTITFDLPTITNIIKLSSNSEILQLKKELKSLKDTVWKLSTNRTILGKPNIDTSYAEPGMIPVLATKDGSFILKNPFTNIIESVNNVYPEKGNVTITPDNIAINNLSLSEYLIQLYKVVEQQKEYIDTLKEQIKLLNKTINELQISLQAHIANPII